MEDMIAKAAAEGAQSISDLPANSAGRNYERAHPERSPEDYQKMTSLLLRHIQSNVLNTCGEILREGCSHERWERHMKNSFQTLRRERPIDRELKKHLRGCSGEFVLSELLRKFVQKYDFDGELCMPEWEKGDRKLSLGEKYILHPYFPHNLGIFHASDHTKSLGELDACLLVGDNNIYLFDATTSETAFHQKIGGAKERTFKEFRNNMMDLCARTEGKQGFEATKIHVVYTDTEWKVKPVLVGSREEPAIFCCMVLCRSLVWKIADKTCDEVTKIRCRENPVVLETESNKQSPDSFRARTRSA